MTASTTEQIFVDFIEFSFFYLNTAHMPGTMWGT
jgi:hypothetical protein